MRLAAKVFALLLVFMFGAEECSGCSTSNSAIFISLTILESEGHSRATVAV